MQVDPKAYEDRIPDTIPEESKLAFLTHMPSFKPMNARRKRRLCVGCNKKRKYVCFECMRYMPKPEGAEEECLPTLVLPLDLHIAHHPTEKLTKSTAVHAGIIAGASTTFHEFPELPEFDPLDTLLVYPDPDAPDLAEMAEAGELGKYTSVVFVDAQWRQAKAVMRAPQLAPLTRVRMGSYVTTFWRYQTHEPDHLATIEAIYYFFAEYARAHHPDRVYDGRYDPLMYLYAHQYELIQARYAAQALQEGPGASIGNLPPTFIRVPPGVQGTSQERDGDA